jgi:hypothetical protein
MVDEFNSTYIENGNYTFDTSKYFFSGDKIHVVIIIYIIISFVFNLLYLISFIKGKTKKKINLILMGNILLINFIHTFSYLYEWILQNVDGKSLYIDNEGKKCVESDCDNSTYNEIGGLLVGNMGHMEACKTQAFFLVFTALSQDIIINIFFYLINKTTKLKSRIIYRFLMFAGYLFPIVFAIVYLVIGGFGLNDKFCFIKKYTFDDEKEISEKQTKYKKEKKFLPLLCLFYLIRIINIIISSGFLYKIVRYITKNKLKKMYIFKACAFLIVQIITILFGIIYRLGGIINNKFSRDFVNIFLIVNTLDGVIFPVVCYFSNNMYKSLCCNNEFDDQTDSFLSGDSDDIDATTNNMTTFQNQTKTGDKTGTTVVKDNKNNFSLSYD